MCIVPIKNNETLQVYKIVKGVTLDTFIPSYVNEDYLLYALNKDNKNTPKYSGFIPDTLDFFGAGQNQTAVGGGKNVYGVADFSNPYNTKYAAKFDRRTDGLLPAVKDQRETNLRWDFSSLGAISTLAAMQQKTKVDLSETNAAYALSNSVSNVGFNRDIADAGSFKMSMAYLTRWECELITQTTHLQAHLALGKQPIT